MIVGIATPEHAIYTQVVAFATATYASFLSVELNVYPDAFAYACCGEKIVGCFGLYLAEGREPLLFEQYVPSAFRNMSGDPDVNRSICAEIGTRAAVGVPGYRINDISLALSAKLLTYAGENELRYLVFTANRTVRTLASTLGMELVCFGRPDLSCMTEVFKKNWSLFFRMPQYCYGFRLESTVTCAVILRYLEQHRICSESVRRIAL